MYHYVYDIFDLKPILTNNPHSLVNPYWVDVTTRHASSTTDASPSHGLLRTATCEKHWTQPVVVNSAFLS